MRIAYAQNSFLDPESAFRFSAAERPGQVEIHYTIADAYYLYRDGFAFAASEGEAVLGAPVFPPSISHFDENFGKHLETYRHEVVIRLPVKAAAGPFDLTVTAQGCADQGVCYPPLTQVYRVSGAALQTKAAEQLAAEQSGAKKSFTDIGMNRLAASTLEPLYDPYYAQAVLKRQSVPVMFAIFFGLGVMMSLLPCSLPMVPILSSIIISQRVPPTRLRSLTLSLAYVLGMAVVYTVAGAVAGLAGANLGIVLQNPWVISAFAALLVIFALSLFGCYELQLPSSWQTRLGAVTQPRAAGKLASVFAMGALSALLVGACMTAPLFGVIAFIAQTRNALLGAAALFALALGLGVPLLVMGAGAGMLLPRVGAWMESLKRSFGMILLAAALWIAMPILPSWATMLLAALWLLLAAIGLKLFEPLTAKPSRTWGQYLGKGIGGVCAILAGILIVGVAAGSRDPFQPLAVFTKRETGAGMRVSAGTPEFISVQSHEALKRAQHPRGRPVMLDFYADWCTSCKKMERSTFADPKVRARLAAFELLRVDLTANRDEDRALLKHFSLYGPPALIFFDANGDEIPGSRVIGYQPAATFLHSLARVMHPTARCARLSTTLDSSSSCR